MSSGLGSRPSSPILRHKEVLQMVESMKNLTVEGFSSVFATLRSVKNDSAIVRNVTDIAGGQTNVVFTLTSEAAKKNEEVILSPVSVFIVQNTSMLQFYFLAFFGFFLISMFSSDVERHNSLVYQLFALLSHPRQLDIVLLLPSFEDF